MNLDQRRIIYSGSGLMGIAHDDNESKKMADLAEEEDDEKKKSVEGGKNDDSDECLQVIRTRGSSPELKASIPSFLFWQWLRPLIIVGNRKPLEPEDLFDLNPKEGTYYCVQRWQESIVKEKKKKRTTKRDSNGAFPSVWRIMFRSFGKELLLGAICKPIWLTAVLLQVKDLSVSLLSLSLPLHRYVAMNWKSWMRCSSHIQWKGLVDPLEG
jgi:hypothetical protein